MDEIVNVHMKRCFTCIVVTLQYPLRGNLKRESEFSHLKKTPIHLAERQMARKGWIYLCPTRCWLGSLFVCHLPSPL